jgi:hypothetical protein
MKNIIYSSLFAVLFLLPSSFIAQTDCFNFVRECPTGKQEGYYYNGQSKSGAFSTGDTSVVVLVAYKGMDYKISLCADKEAVDGKIDFRIVEKVKKPYNKEITITEEVAKKDAQGEDMFDPETDEPIMETVTRTEYKRRFKTKEIIRFDSKKSDNDFFSVRSDQTKKYYVEVIVPPARGEGDSLESEDGKTFACVGLLVEHRKGPRTQGFSTK